MHHLQGAGGAQHTVVSPAEKTGGLDHEKRPQPFAAAEAGIAHGVEEMGGPGDFAGEKFWREQLVEPRLDLCGNRGEVLVKGARQ